MSILSRISVFFNGDEKSRAWARAKEKRIQAEMARMYARRQHDLYPDPHSLLPPTCRPGCPRCADDAEQARKAAVRRERHVPDPHYGDWGS
jgi:hypothetical protein